MWNLFLVPLGVRQQGPRLATPMDTYQMCRRNIRLDEGQTSYRRTSTSRSSSVHDESTSASATDYSTVSINWRPAVAPVKSVRDLGIYIDADLTMRRYRPRPSRVKRTVSQRFAALRKLRQIRRSVPLATFQSLVVTLVLTRLDYGNALLQLAYQHTMYGDYSRYWTLPHAWSFTCDLPTTSLVARFGADRIIDRRKKYFTSF